MIRTDRRRYGIALLLASASGVGMIGAQTPTGDAIPRVEEYLLLGDATRGAGEPMIAVDPTNPHNIVAVAMGDLHRPDDSPVTHGMTDAYHALPNSTITWLGVTHDGGRTWKVGELPILDHKKLTRCPDSFVSVSADGTFYAGCEPRETSGDFYGGSYIVVSRDKGDTWGPPVAMITSYDVARFDPALKPRIGGNSPWDRPFLRIDESTGVIYGQAGGGETDIDQKPGTYRTQSYLTASTDRGKSFGTIYAWDSKEYPEIGRGDFTAANGVVLAVYQARTAPGSEGAACPCTVMGLSHDRGKTYRHRVLSFVPPQPRLGPPPGGGASPSGGKPLFPGAGGPGGLKLAADQKTPGKFALMTIRNDAVQVAITNDYGSTWTPWNTVGSVPETKIAKPWMEYSDDGKALAILWRAIHADGAYDIYSTASRDGGTTFAAPLRISQRPSPFRFDERAGGWFGDDIQNLVVVKDTVYMVWGDSRSGFLGVWFARAPLSAYGAPQ